MPILDVNDRHKPVLVGQNREEKLERKNKVMTTIGEISQHKNL